MQNYNKLMEKTTNKQTNKTITSVRFRIWIEITVKRQNFIYESIRLPEEIL